MTSTLEQAVELALQLSPAEQAKLLEQVAASLANRVEDVSPSIETGRHWGRELLALLDKLDTSDWETIEDPVAWLKEQRKSARGLDWGNEE